jgi:pimeloyl-ACP methyl ester carboxylesterase
MRVAARHRSGRSFADPLFEESTRQVFLRGEWVDVVRLGQGDPIVLVPGLAGGWKLLRPLAEHLARHHEVVVVGLRGDRFPQGTSGARNLEDYASDLACLIDGLGLERPTIFGVSFGGAIALELALNEPRRAGALVLYGTEARFHATLGATVARRVLERFPLPSDNGFLNQFFNLLHGGKPEPGPLVDFIIERCWETDQCVMARRLGLLETFDVSDRLWQVAVPTLVLAGTRDVIVPCGRQRALASSVAGARFEAIEGAGHIGFLTHRAEVARQVRRHLSQVGHLKSQR